MPEWLGWLGSEFVEVDVVGRLLLAALLGSLIGIERERSQKAAGFRTNILICVASTLVMELSFWISKGWGASADPTRIPAQIVSGIGFLGAGTILVARGRVVGGLTTAATIWAVAGVGIAVGAHAYTHAVAGTILIVVVLSFLGRIEDYLFGDDETKLLEIDVKPASDLIAKLEDQLRRKGLKVRVGEIEKLPSHHRVLIEVRGSLVDPGRLFAELSENPDVQRVSLLPVQLEK